jgi:hypothetical protein
MIPPIIEEMAIGMNVFMLLIFLMRVRVDRFLFRINDLEICQFV